MKTKTIPIYSFAELSDDAKQHAKDCFAEAVSYSWGDDALASLKALAVHFGGKLSDWSIDWFNASHSSASFEMPEMGAAEIRRRLKALGGFDRKTLKGHGDCKLTGYCADDDAIDGFRVAFHGGERDLTALMGAAFDTWLAAAHADCEAQFTDENFGETCEANDYQFTENGVLP